MDSYSSVRKTVQKKGYANINVSDGEYMYIVRINKSSDDFNYDVLRKEKI